jgi:hypothetical protein
VKAGSDVKQKVKNVKRKVFSIALDKSMHIFAFLLTAGSSYMNGPTII